MRREIRQFRPEDAATVAQMWNESDSAWPGGFIHGVPMTPERVLREQSQTRFINTFIAFADDKAVGYCSLMRFWQDPRVAYVALLSAHPAYHGQGFGRDLLKAALARTVELGFDRLDLYTWAGNLKAVPLYKKMGFFWVPGTAVHMQNYLPTIFRQGLAREFLSGADWYDCHRRDLSIRPDDITVDGMKVYPYEFERAGRRLRMLVDPESRGITAVETDAFALACRSTDRKAPIGRPTPLRWEVRNLRPASGPLRTALTTSVDAGLHLELQQIVDVAERTTLEAPVAASRNARERHPDDPAHLVRTTAVVGESIVELTTGLRVCPSVEVAATDRCVYLTPGVPKPVALTVHSNLPTPAKARLRLATSPELRVEPAELEVDLPAGGYVPATTTATATGAGALDLVVHLTIEAPGLVEQPSPQTIPVHSVALGDVVASFDGRRAYLTTAQLRVVVNRRAASVSVVDAVSGERLADNSSTLGPPFGPGELDSLDFDVDLERRGSSVTAVLSCRPTDYPGLVYQRHVEVAPGPAVRVGHRVINGTDTAQRLQVQTTCRGGPERARVAAPLSEGLVVEEAIGYPDWQEPRWTGPASFAETWLAYAGETVVTGWVWEQASSVEVGGWSRFRLALDLPEAGPGEAVDSPALWLYCGPGGWEAVRGFWRSTLRPDAPRRAAPAHRALEIDLEPPILLGDEAALHLRSFRGRVLSGNLRLELPEGLRAEPESFDVAGWARGEPHRQSVRFAWPEAAAGAWGGKVRATTDTWIAEFPLTVIKAGDAGSGVHVREEKREGQTVIVVDNGHLSFAVAPDFGGALVELRDERASHVFSAFPQERPFHEFNPWYGGVTPQACPAETFGDSQPMAARAYRWECVERAGLAGQTWRGIALSATPEHKDLVGLTFRVEYLTLGRSNLVAVVTRLEGRGGPPRMRHGLLAFPAPGGSWRDARAHFERGGPWTEQPTTATHASVGGWAALENPSTGDVVALVSGGASAEVSLYHEATDWVALGAQALLDAAEPSRGRETVSFLVLARSLATARLYRALAQRQAWERVGP